MDLSLFNGMEVCSTCVSFRFFTVFVLLRETGSLWENWLVAKTVIPSQWFAAKDAEIGGVSV